MIHTLQKQLANKEQEYKKIEGECEEDRQLYQIEKDRYLEQKKELLKCKNTLVNEINAINDDNNHLLEKKQNIEKDSQELKDAIETLKLGLEDVDEKLLRLNLKINQAVNEKSRLEKDYQKFTKVGK